MVWKKSQMFSSDLSTSRNLIFSNFCHVLRKNKYSGANLQKKIVTPFNLHEKYEKYAPIIAFYAIFDYFYIKNMIFTKKSPSRMIGIKVIYANNQNLCKTSFFATLYFCENLVV